MSEYTVRRFDTGDAVAVYELISKTAYTTNSILYEDGYIKEFLKWVEPDMLIERASRTHFYVICDGDTVICSGAIGPYMGREDESELLNIYLLPEYQGMGVGRMIVETLERDEYYLRAKRIVVRSSLNALKFYKRFGYDHVNGEFAIGEDDTFSLEKFR